MRQKWRRRLSNNRLFDFCKDKGRQTYHGRWRNLFQIGIGQMLALNIREFKNPKKKNNNNLWDFNYFMWAAQNKRKAKEKGKRKMFAFRLQLKCTMQSWKEKSQESKGKIFVAKLRRESERMEKKIRKNKSAVWERGRKSFLLQKDRKIHTPQALCSCVSEVQIKKIPS